MKSCTSNAWRGTHVLAAVDYCLLRYRTSLCNRDQSLPAGLGCSPGTALLALSTALKVWSHQSNVQKGPSLVLPSLVLLAALLLMQARFPFLLKVMKELIAAETKCLGSRCRFDTWKHVPNLPGLFYLLLHLSAHYHPSPAAPMQKPADEYVVQGCSSPTDPFLVPLSVLSFPKC